MRIRPNYRQKSEGSGSGSKLGVCVGGEDEATTNTGDNKATTALPERTDVRVLQLTLPRFAREASVFSLLL